MANWKKFKKEQKRVIKIGSNKSMKQHSKNIEWQNKK